MMTQCGGGKESLNAKKTKTQTKKSHKSENRIFEEGLEKSIELLYACSNADGFLASPTKQANYHRVWGRDGAILALAALLTGDNDLIKTARQTLETLAEYQGPHGEIPSNVDTQSGRISYGGMAGRVDADLWFIIACGEYWKHTGDDEFLDKMMPVIEKIRFLLGTWEFNNRGLLYIPQTGDWADEYLHHGYVLYDQLLYLQVHRTIHEIHAHLHGSPDHSVAECASRLRHLIQANYWFNDDGDIPEDVYHEVIYKKGYTVDCQRRGKYWLPYFSPHGYGYRFDSFANVLSSFLGVCDDHQREKIDVYIESTLNEDLPLLPAFHPVITPVDDEDWQDLKMTFSYKFKNRPHEYHNGGLWPMITGFYVADLAKRGETDKARSYLRAVHKANALEMEGEEWSFPEYVHGQELTPGGTRWQGWSAAGAIIGHYALEGKYLFEKGKRQ